MERRHQWVAVMPYELTDQEARQMMTEQDDRPITQLAGGEHPALEDRRPFFGTHNLIRDMVTVGCLKCEEPWSEEAEARPCSGEPEGKLAYVDERGQDRYPDEAIAGGQVPAPAALRGVGRNDPCPCGSGKKFKRCHGQ